MRFHNIGERETSSISACASRTSNDMAFLDHVVMVLEEIQFHYALQQTVDTVMASPEQAADDTLAGGAHPSITTERTYPFPSLFLWTPDAMVREWRTQQLSKEAVQTRPQEPLRNFFDSPPQALSTANVSCTSGTRDMLTVDLREGTRNGVITVLQSELGMGIDVDSVNGPRACPSKETLLLSPDATSCVLIACRVSLHEHWKAERGRTPDDVALPEDLQTFLHLCRATCTASMAHLDNKECCVEAVHQLLWESAIPAWLHAITEHYKTTIMHLDGTEEGESNSDRAAKAMLELHTLLGINPNRPSASEEPLIPLLRVEWFIVGGIRMKEHAAGILGDVFRAFFGKTGWSPLQRDAKRVPVELLATRVPLSALLNAGHEGGPVCINLDHRLREDGLCFWSFNTRMASWSMDRDSNRRYAYAVCWGLLLSVRSGHCWPVRVKPGTRYYPFQRLRSVLSDRNRWICPTEWEGKLVVSDNLVSSSAVADTVNADAQGILNVQSLERACIREVNGCPSGGVQSLSVTLLWYVRQCLKILRSWDNERSRDRKAIFPLLLRCGRAWSRVEETESNRDMHLLPDEFFLQCSTTPHCEPEDFGALAKLTYLTMMKWAPTDVFVGGTQGVVVY